MPSSPDSSLFNGAQLPVIGDKIRAAGFNPDGYHTKEEIEAIKKAVKTERSIAKMVTLGLSYGMGADLLVTRLKIEGVSLTKEDAEALLQGYWEIYPGVKKWEKSLVRTWHKTGGYVLDGLGMPVPVAKDKLKDIVNRVVQRTGHQILVIVNSIMLPKLMKLKGFKPVVWDWHDETMIEVDESETQKAIQIFNWAYSEVNRRLGTTLPIKHGPEIISSLAEAKLD